jgi:molecular chaperone DnaJ
LQYILSIDLKTSIFWGKEKIVFNKKEECPTCHGEWWSGKKTCPKCGGKWQVVHTSQSIFGTIQQTVICNECSGSWEIFENICSECHWEKRILIKKELEIDIPIGIDDGMVIKLTWEWNSWVWTKSKWDLYIKFEVPNEEKWLKRDGINLYYETEIEVVQAVLWTTKEINIPIIWKRKIEVKSWTESGNIIKISGDWVKHIDKDKKWDLFIEVNIKIPKKLSKREKELYEEIAKEKKIDVNKGGVFWKIFW